MAGRLLQSGAVQGLGEDARLARPTVHVLLLGLVGGPRAVLARFRHAFAEGVDFSLAEVIYVFVDFDEAGEATGTFAEHIVRSTTSLA